MAVCFPAYGINAAKEFGRNIWSALKLEACIFFAACCINGPYSKIFQPTDSLTEEIALNTLRAFVRVLISSWLDGTDNTIDTLVRTICTDSLGSIGQPEKVQAKAGVKVLCMLADVPCTSMLAFLMDRG